MDSSDDDKPIASLVARAVAKAKPSSAPATLNIPKQAVRIAPPVVKKSATSTIDSDDDDVPLAVLMKRKLEAVQKNISIPSKIIKTAPAAKKMKIDTGSKNPSRKVNDKKVKGKKKKSSISSKSAAVVSSQGSNSRTSVYYDSEKGKVVQALMVRWWYVIQWPEPGTVKKSPPGYESLNGFPGVCVGTRVLCCCCYISAVVDVLFY